MNEESLAKYIKALPDNMLNEYDAAAAAGAQGNAGAGTGGTISGRTGGNKNRFPFIAPLLVLVGVIIAVTAVIIARNNRKNHNIVLSEDPSGMTSAATTLSPAEAQTPTEVAETPEFTDTPAPTATTAPTDTPAPTATPEPTGTTAPTATSEPAGTPAPTDVSPEDVIISLCIEQNGKKIYPLNPDPLRRTEDTPGILRVLDNLPDDLSQIKANAPVIYSEDPFSLVWNFQPKSPEWIKAGYREYEYCWIVEKGENGAEENKLQRFSAESEAKFKAEVTRYRDVGNRRYLAVILHKEVENGYDLVFPTYVFCFVTGSADSTPTPAPTAAATPIPGRIDHLDPVITKGELQVGESLQLSYRTYPENYDYGTVRWKLTFGFDCASLDPETGVLTALKPGSVGVLPYVVEYETKNSPAGLVITEKYEEPDYYVPKHDKELSEKYRPDAVVSGDGWTEERIRIRNSFLVYNGQTPDDLPKYKRRTTDDYSYGNSPYENDLVLFVRFYDHAYMDTTLHNRAIALKGIKVTFTDAVTGETVGYSYTNADGIAMFTVKKQEIDFIVSAEIPGYNNSNPGSEEYRHIIYPGGGDQNGFEDNVAYSGPYTNSGIVRSYSIRVFGNDAAEYTFKVLNAATGAVLDGGVITFYYEGSYIFSYGENDKPVFFAYDDYFALIERVTYTYGERYPRKTVECTFERSGNTVIIYAQIPQDEPQIRIDRASIVDYPTTMHVGESVKLSYVAYPETYNYGTVKFRLVRDEDCAYINPDTGELIALKPGSIAVEVYVEEYDFAGWFTGSPVGIKIVE
ncbi:MAG: hypothetical protein J5950_01925 [Clostridia bacterium]|nr:hypothetical protein [Clostridia bacterium]